MSGYATYEAYGDEAYGDEAYGDEAYGDEAYGDEAGVPFRGRGTGNTVSQQQLQTALAGVRSDMAKNAAAITSLGRQVDVSRGRTSRDLKTIRDESRNTAMLLVLLPLLTGDSSSTDPMKALLPLMIIMGGFSTSSGGGGGLFGGGAGGGQDMTMMLVLVLAMSGSFHKT